MFLNINKKNVRAELFDSLSADLTLMNSAETKGELEQWYNRAGGKRYFAHFDLSITTNDENDLLIDVFACEYVKLVKKFKD